MHMPLQAKLVNLTDEQRCRLDEICAVTGRTMNDVIRAFIDAGLRQMAELEAHISLEEAVAIIQEAANGEDAHEAGAEDAHYERALAARGSGRTCGR
jgi:hypothetical protein